MEETSDIFELKEQIAKAIRLDAKTLQLKLDGRQIPHELFELNSLEILTLRGPAEIPEEICKLINLKRLSIQKTKNLLLPESLKKLQNLRIVHLDSCGLQEIPAVLMNMTEIEELKFIRNNISDIPSKIVNLNKLRELNLSGNKISVIPDFLVELKNLNILWLYNNNISNLPNALFDIQTLTTLSLQSNPIAQIPNDIKKLDGLTKLRLGNMKLNSIPKAIYEMTSLRSLCLEQCGIKKIDPNIKYLQNIRELNLSKNLLTTLPKEIGKLSELVELNICNNLINNLPDSICNLNKLIFFNISKNKLEKLPRKFYELALAMRNNSNDSGEYRNVIYEELINLNDNMFNIPKEMYSKKAEEIIRYILDIQLNQESKPLHEAKLIFIGSGNVGKTSIVNMLLTGNIGTPEETKGISINDMYVANKGNQVKLHIWDFGGQEIMHATHKFFMTNRSIYVLVINPRTEDKQGETDVEYWLKLIRSYAGEVPVIIAINKCEVHTVDLGKGELQDKYKNIIGFVDTSCYENKGIPELKKLIKKAIYKLEHINIPLPRSYFDVKQELENTNKDYIQYSAYEKLCKRVDPKFSQESMLTLVGLLNDLGIMLNFRDEHLRSLPDTQVLNPEWVTQGVYKIITSSEIIKKKGILSLLEISQILKSDKYPSIKEHSYIMDIMQNFELCFCIPDYKDRYFIPGAFPKDRPKLNWKSNENGVIKFIFQYDVMPSSIISRFIVKVHQLIRNNDYWRNGVVIQKDDCVSLIRGDQEEKKIYIEVLGSGNKRDFLAFIRGQFDLIHGNLSNINVKKFIHINENGKEALVDYEDLLYYEKVNVSEIPIKEIDKVCSVTKLLNGIEEEYNRLAKLEEVAIHKDSDLENAYYGREIQIMSKNKILFISSNPTDTSRLRLDKEMRDVEEGLKRANKRDEFVMVKKVATRPIDLRRALLDEEPQFLHFTGHGNKTGRNSIGGIVLEDENGEAKVVSSSSLSDLLELFKDSIKCVILNSCYSEEQAKGIVKHIKYVVGMSDAVNDENAIIFAISFYDALAAGRDIEFAFKFAKTSIDVEGLDDKDIPVLYRVSS